MSHITLIQGETFRAGLTIAGLVLPATRIEITWRNSIGKQIKKWTLGNGITELSANNYAYYFTNLETLAVYGHGAWQIEVVSGLLGVKKSFAGTYEITKATNLTTETVAIVPTNFNLMQEIDFTEVTPTYQQFVAEFIGVVAKEDAEAARDAAQGFRDEAEGFATSADTDAATATTQAGIATAKASEANISATTATTQAETATTQAGIATTQASTATTAKNTTESLRNEVIAAYNNLTTQGNFKGTWNASTNSPALTTTPSAANDYYEVTVAGTQSITGSSTAFVLGDRVRSNGTAWVRVPFAIADNSLTGAKIQDGAITREKTTFFQAGRNLYDPNQTLLLNSLFNATTGAIQTNVVWSNVIAPAYIEALGSTDYTHSSNGACRVAEYDINKVFIQLSNNFWNANSITTNSNTRFMRIQFGDNIIPYSSFMLRKVSDSSVFEAYRIEFKENLNAAKVFEHVPLSTLATKTDLTQKASLLPGKNIFNPAQTILANTQFNPNGLGGLQTNVVFPTSMSDFIPVQSLTAYTHNSIGSARFGEYDLNKTWIRLGANFATGASHITHSSAAFIRVQFSASINTFQIEKGTTTTFFEAYRLEVNETFNSEKVTAALPAFINRLSLPSKIYLLSGRENNIYYKGIQWRWNPFSFYTRLVGTGIKNSASRAYITTPSGTISATANLHNADFDIVNTKTISLVTSSPLTNNGAIKLLAIGDSYTEPAFWFAPLTTNCPAISFVGTRRGHPSTPSTLFHEGRSGWTMNNYFTVTQSQFFFSPFLQPIDPYKYYGNTAFWIAAIAGGVNNQDYATAIANGFNATTGYKTSPSINDVMYSNANARYEVWDGSAWVVITLGTLNFSFNFAKYRTVWGVAQPDMVSLMLGVNDFSSTSWRTSSATLATFKTQLDAMIASVKADNANVKFIVVLPTSCFGDIENQNDIFTPSRNANMFVQREMLITNYDNREGEKIYLCDTGSAIDPDFGWITDALTPFPEYTGTAKRNSVRDAIHPSDGYAQIGIRMSAVVQGIR